jgi:hypothetical protein
MNTILKGVNTFSKGIFTLFFYFVCTILKQEKGKFLTGYVLYSTLLNTECCSRDFTVSEDAGIEPRTA